MEKRGGGMTDPMVQAAVGRQQVVVTTERRAFLATLVYWPGSGAGPVKSRERNRSNSKRNKRAKVMLPSGAILTVDPASVSLRETP